MHNVSSLSIALPRHISFQVVLWLRKRRQLPSFHLHSDSIDANSVCLQVSMSVARSKGQISL